MKAVTEPNSTGAPAQAADYESLLVVRRHLRFGWWSLLVFLSLGLVLEILHGRKAGLYLDVSNSTRRLMWTLAHAHGTLLALVHIAFGATAHLLPTWTARSRALASVFLMSSSLMIPIGFFLGGVVIYGGDPGLGILLVPLGAAFLFMAVLLVARASSRSLAGMAHEKSGKKKGMSRP
jgi:hypothetical protein